MTYSHSPASFQYGVGISDGQRKQMWLQIVHQYHPDDNKSRYHQRYKRRKIMRCYDACMVDSQQQSCHIRRTLLVDAIECSLNCLQTEIYSSLRRYFCAKYVGKGINLRFSIA